MKTPEIISAGFRDRDRVIHTMMLGFASDPLIRWSWPDEHDYLTYFPKFTHAFGGKAFDCATAYTIADDSGAALWLPPGIQPDETAMGALMLRSFSLKRLWTASTLMKRMRAFHPAEPHWYLPLIAVDPARRGCGYGSALLRHGLELIDRKSEAAFLESTSPASLPLYRRFGFEVLGTIQVDDAPPVFPMLRQAAR